MINNCKSCQKEEKKGFINSLLGRSVRLITCEWCSDKSKYCGDCINYMPGDAWSVKLLKSESDRYSVSWLCKACQTKFSSDKRKMQDAINNNESVEIVSKNYRGYKRTSTKDIRLSSDYYKDRDDAVEELRILASFYDCNLIDNFEFIKDSDEESTESGGTYIYTVWKAVGNGTNAS